jgi:hypothetical protein
MMPVRIQGPKQPSNDIDVYLRPLVDELLHLWDVRGVRMWDEHKQRDFLANRTLALKETSNGMTYEHCYS